MDRNNMAPDQSTSYGIGSVSRLTGLTTHTLRAWEKRHGAIEAARDAAGRRRYTVADVERLTRLKQLVDLGERIGDLARLSPEALEQRLAAALATATAPRVSPARIGIFGPAARTLGPAFRSRSRDFEVVSVAPDVAPADVAPYAANLDCIVLDVPSLGPGDATRIEKLTQVSADCAVVLVYAFARDTELRRLEQAGVVLIGSISGSADIRRAVSSATRQQRRPEQEGDNAGIALARAAAGGPRFTSAELTRLASISTDIECECPHHLVSLISYLRAFEQYSTDCKNRNPADAAMHEFLCRETQRASHIIENGLRHLIEFEGIDLVHPESQVR
jgi:DNA-binding transcriptional MerR regulator